MGMVPMDAKRLVGRKVQLRPLTRDDLDLRLKWVNDPVVQRMSVGITTSGNDPIDMQAWFHLVSEDPLSEQWAIELLDRPGEYLGDIDLHSINERDREAWINPLFADPAIRPPEMRRDVLDTIARYVFGTKGLKRLWAQIPNTDADTIAVMDAMGFETVEETPLEIFEGVNELTMRLPRHTWEHFGSRAGGSALEAR